MEENMISMQEIFVFRRKGIGADGKVVGVFEPTRIRPRFLDKLRVAGLFLSPSIFEETVEVK
jgi:pilus assembly protein CpaF